MADALIPMVCQSCLHRWAERVRTTGEGAVVTCPQCDASTTPLEAAAAAWALGQLPRGEFFAIAGLVSPDDITETLAALARVTTWWESRHGRDEPGDAPAGGSNGRERP